MVEAALHREEGMETVVAEFEFWPEESMENAQVGAIYSNGWRNGGIISEAFCENLIEVITHLGFQHYRFVDLKTKTGANTGEIGFGLGEAKIVGVNAGLNVIVLSKRSWRQANNK